MLETQLESLAEGRHRICDVLSFLVLFSDQAKAITHHRQLGGIGAAAAGTF